MPQASGEEMTQSLPLRAISHSRRGQRRGLDEGCPVRPEGRGKKVVPIEIQNAEVRLPNSPASIVVQASSLQLEFYICSATRGLLCPPCQGNGSSEKAAPRFFAAGGLDFTTEDPLWSPFSRGTKEPNQRSGPGVCTFGVRQRVALDKAGRCLRNGSTTKLIPRSMISYLSRSER